MGPTKMCCIYICIPGLERSRWETGKISVPEPAWQHAQGLETDGHVSETGLGSSEARLDSTEGSSPPEG